MTNKKESYSCWILINQNKEKRLFTTDEQSAAETFVSFLSDKNYGKGIRLFRFDICVEPTINFGHHVDSVYLGSAHLSANIDYETFTNADSKYRQKLLLNAALTLCKYLSEKVVLPRDFDAQSLIKDFTGYLSANALLLSDEETKESIVKLFDTTKFNFIITSTIEVKKKDIHYDLMNIQDYLNNQLSGKTFGKSVRQFDFGYEIFDFKGFLKPWKQTANLKRYGTKYKSLLVVKQFDYRQLKGKKRFEQFEILKEKIIEAINDTDNLSRKPKDFDKQAFLTTIEDHLNDYQNKYCR